jgi:Ser/Thr protein kinase RdoA (MazF antagonist)
MENRVYEVELDLELPPDAAKWEGSRVVKFYRPGRWTREAILEEHSFLFEAAAVDIPVVLPLRFPSGGTLQRLSDDLEVYFAVFPKVGGRLLDELSPDELEQIGRLIARLHNVGSQKRFQHRQSLTVDSYGYDNISYLREQRIVPATIEPHLFGIVERILAVTSAWFSDVERLRIHGDCHLGNILWLWSRSSLVDFDDCLTGPAVQDLWLLTPGRDSDSMQRQELLIRGYSSLRSFDYDSLRLREPLRALRMINFSSWIARRIDDPSFKRVFVDYGSDSYWREQLVALQEVAESLGIG